MTEPEHRWAEWVAATARTLPYPTTPDLATRRLASGRARPRPRLAWALGLLLALGAAVLAVPEVRAGLMEFLQLGAVRIRLLDPTPTVAPTPTASLLPAPPPTTRPRAAATPTPTLSSVLALAGETTLAEARHEVPFPIIFPPALGPPDHVFVQEMNGPVVVLVWLDPAAPDRARISLHLLGPGTLAQKVLPRVVRETSVGGRRALWTEGPYLIQLGSGPNQSRLVEGHVLIWTEGEITYRLESDLPLTEAIRLAEALPRPE